MFLIHSPIKSCALILNGSLNQTNSSRVVQNTRLNFTAENMTSGVYGWSVNCTDSTEDFIVGSSLERIIIVSTDVVAPTISIIEPDNAIQDIDGNLTFKFNVTDFASGIANCSLVVNGTRNQTMFRRRKMQSLISRLMTLVARGLQLERQLH